VSAVKAEADRYAANVLPIIREAQKAGARTLREIADRQRDRHGTRRAMVRPERRQCSRKRLGQPLSQFGYLLAALAVTATAFEAP
jgi:hypothetical protein